MPIDYYGAHSIVFIHSQVFAFDDVVPDASEKNYYHSWLDFHMVPTVRPHIETPEAEIVMYSDTVSSKVFDLTNARLGFQKFSSLKGQWEFIIDHDRWTDWVAAKAAIEDYFNGRRIMCALMDDPTVAYFGRAFLSNWDDGEDYSRVTIYYDFNYEPKAINVDFLKPVSITASLRSDAPYFYRRESTSDIIPYVLAVATYGNGRQDEVKIDYVSPLVFNTVGDNTIDVAYPGFTGAHTNLVINVKEDEISKIIAKYKDDGPDYSPVVGDSIDKIRDYIYIDQVFKSGTIEKNYGGYIADQIDGVYTYTGKQYVTISYSGCTTQIETTVTEDYPISIKAVFKDPNQKVYRFDPYDLIRSYSNIEVTYKSGKVETIDGMNAEPMSGYIKSAAGGTSTATIRYFVNGTYLNSTLSFNVEPEFVASIKAIIKGGTESVNLLTDDEIDLVRNCIDLRVTYSNGDYTLPYAGTFANYIPGTFDNIGAQNVQVTYQGKSTSVPVYIYNKDDTSIITKVWVNFKNGTPTFIIGDDKDLVRNTIYLTLTYSISTNKNRRIDGLNADTISGQFDRVTTTYSIPIYYKGIRTRNGCYVTVVPISISSFSISYKSGASSTYNIGDSKDLIRERIQIELTYNNGTTEVIDGINAEPVTGYYTNEGTEQISITYNGQYGSVHGTVEATVVEGSVSSIVARYNTGPSPTFTIREAKDSIRQYISLDVTYSNGYTRTIDGTEADPITGNFTTIGTESVTITYGGKSTTIDVTVVDYVLVSITANYKSGENPAFAVGDDIDMIRQHINIDAIYNDGIIETIDGSNADQIAGTFDTVGTQSVTISYNGKTTNINATVVLPTIYHFSVDNNGSTTVTKDNQNSSNDTARITYNESYNVIVPNGTVGTLTYGFSVNSNGDIIVGNAITGADSITVNNGGSFDLNVVIET